MLKILGRFMNLLAVTAAVVLLVVVVQETVFVGEPTMSMFCRAK